MTDRELLELAAKAAGIQLVWHNFSNIPSLFTWLSSDEMWNPLADDGDALRLAVSLRIDVHYGDSVVVAERVFPQEVGVAKAFDGDILAATRRAIVRAAAEIGRQMP